MTNNKQQTVVKLYTEEQLLNTAEAIRDYLKNYPEKFHESMIKKHLTALTPIELPSDEEIREERLLQFPDSEYANRANDRLAFYCGAKFVINKIQGGNK